MVIGTALGFSNFETIVLAVALAFVFGYTLTSLPLLRAGLAFSAVVPIALASDTLSIATMEVVDNAVMLAVPGAMHAGVDTLLFWGSLSFALAVAFVLTVPVNRWLLARGKGHTAVHETGIHGGPPTKVVGAAVIFAFVFGTTVVVDRGDHQRGHGSRGMAGTAPMTATGHGSSELTLASSTARASEPRRRAELPAGRRRRRCDHRLRHRAHQANASDRRSQRPLGLPAPASADGGRRDLDDAAHPARGRDYRVFADFSHEGARSNRRRRHRGEVARRGCAAPGPGNDRFGR